MYQIKWSLCDVGDISFINASLEYNVTPSKIQSLVFKLIFYQDWINLKFNVKRSANQSSESSIKCKFSVIGIFETSFLAGITRSRSLESNQRYLVQRDDGYSLRISSWRFQRSRQFLSRSWQRRWWQNESSRQGCHEHFVGS